MPDIPFWNKCDNRCVMCTNAGSFAMQDPAQYSLKGQIKKLELYLAGRGGVYLKNSGKADFISLTGGEPAIHPEFFKTLAYFRRRLPSTPITLLTNGRRFADPSFCRRFLRTARPPFALAVALHGADARSHDVVAGVRGAFAATARGLRNLYRGLSGQELEVRIILHRLSVRGLRRTLSWLLREMPDVSRYRVTAIHYEIEGMSLENHSRLALRLEDSAAALGRAADLIGRFGEFRLYHYPLCALPPALRPLAWITLPREDRVYPAARCSGCRLRPWCLGLMKEYRRFFGDAGLKAVRGGR